MKASIKYRNAQYTFNDSINGQPQPRPYKNSISIPTSTQQSVVHHYAKENGVNSNQASTNFYHQSQQMMNSGLVGTRQRFAPYPFYKRSYAHALVQPTTNHRYQPKNSVNITNQSMLKVAPISSDMDLFSQASNVVDISNISASSGGHQSLSFHGNNPSSVTLQISNLDTTIEENELKQCLINRLKPITTVLSIYFESLSVAKIRLPSDHQARQVIAYLHRKKIGHKRITVSYTRESSTLDSSTLRCQVAGLLKDIPNYKLSMYKFRELFQSRFKTSISVIDLHEMKDICTIIGNKNEEYITLRSELIDSIENSELMECFQHSVPYCTLHFVKTHRGWAEQEIDPLPNVQMTISQVRDIMSALLKNHKNVIPIATIVHCIQAELNISLERNENGVNFEHLISCVQGVQITSNKFSIKCLNYSNTNSTTMNCDKSPKEKESFCEDTYGVRYLKYGNLPDVFSQISREIVELIKLSPKATLKFSRFIPAYHNHFGKQCRVADYGYTKLIDLFEALSMVVQVMGEGENRQITLTHRVQMQRFKTDLLRILRIQSTKSILLSQMPMIYEQVQGRKFNITDYGVCDINDILDALVNTNVVVVAQHVTDTMISIPKRKQSAAEVDKTSNFAAEVVELFKHASQYTILFEKFACSYHYHFAHQCRLSDYGFLKLADLMEAITGIVEMEFSNEEDRKIFLSPKTAQRIFSEQLKELVTLYTGGASDTLTNLYEILFYHKKHYGYQILPQSLGFDDMLTCIKDLPYIEVITYNGCMSIKCYHDDQSFRQKSYAAVHLLLEDDQNVLSLSGFMKLFADTYNYVLDEQSIGTMKHAIEIHDINGTKCVTITKMMRFVMHLINVIENYDEITMHELSNILQLSIKACFPFGYPNLATFMQAFPDIFVYTKSCDTFAVNPQCILSKNNKNFIADNNNNNNNINNNNNESNAIDFNRNIGKKFYGNPGDPPKPDTPPSTPYCFWNNPIWGSEVCSPVLNVKIDIPDLKVANITLSEVLNSPLVMADIEKKNILKSSLF